MQNTIYVLHNSEGVQKKYHEDVNATFLEYDKKLLGLIAQNRIKVHADVVSMRPVVSEEQSLIFRRNFTANEVE